MQSRSLKKADYFEQLTWREVTREYQGYQEGKQRALLEIMSRFFKLLTLLGFCVLALFSIGGLAFDLVPEVAIPKHNSPE